MEKNLTYRSSSKGVAEQYGISLSKKMLTDMGITPANRKSFSQLWWKNKDYYYN